MITAPNDQSYTKNGRLAGWLKFLAIPGAPCVLAANRPAHRRQAEKDEPQPQVFFATGLLNLKPEPFSEST
jgi:hypothetical protein